jgi:hypothetical protein
MVLARRGRALGPGELVDAASMSDIIDCRDVID